MLGLRGPASVTTSSHRGEPRSPGWLWTPPQLRCGVERIVHCVDEILDQAHTMPFTQKALACLQTRLKCQLSLARLKCQLSPAWPV